MSEYHLRTMDTEYNSAIVPVLALAIEKKKDKKLLRRCWMKRCILNPPPPKKKKCTCETPAGTEQMSLMTTKIT